MPFWSRKRAVDWPLLVNIGAQLEAKSSKTEDTNLLFIHPETARSVLERKHIKDLFSSLLWYDEDDRTFLYQNLSLIICILISIRWTEWDRFQDYFFTPGQGLKVPRYTDADLPILAEDFFERKPEEFSRQFRNCQYQFVPVVIRQHSHSTYRNHHRLPILKREGLHDSAGAQGVVEKVYVEKKFLWYATDAVNRAPEVMACKRITARTQAGNHNFNNEKAALERFKRCLTNNENIMQSFASFIHGDDFIILSPWASGRDLHLFLNRPHDILDDYPTKSIRFTPNNLLTEAYSLARALKYLHHELITANGRRLRCAHLDLKPENVLVAFLPDDRTAEAPVGRWKISDFGLSKVEEAVTAGRVLPVASDDQVASRAPGNIARELSMQPLPRGPGAFQPPEVQNSGQAKVSTRRDVWSFGCILAMVLAFALNGAEEVKEQTQRRAGSASDDYFYRKAVRHSRPGGSAGDSVGRHGSAELKPAVLEWFTQIVENADARHKDWIKDTSDLILRLLDVDVTTRPEISVAVNKLHIITAHTERIAQDRLWTFNDGDKFREPVIDPPTDMIDYEAPSHTQFVGVRGHSPSSSGGSYSALGQRSPGLHSRRSSGASSSIWAHADPSQSFAKVAVPHQCIGATIDAAGHTGALWSARDLRIYDLGSLQRNSDAWSANPTTRAADECTIEKFILHETSNLMKVRLAGSFLALLEKAATTTFSIKLMVKAGLPGKRYQLRSTFTYNEAPEDIELSQNGALAIRFVNRIHLRMYEPSATIPLNSTTPSKDFVHMAFTASGEHFCLWERDKWVKEATRRPQNYWSLWTIGTNTDRDFRLLCPTIRSPLKSHDGQGKRGQAFLASFGAYSRFIACDRQQHMWLIRADDTNAPVHYLGRTDNATACFMLPYDESFLLIRSSQHEHLKVDRCIISFTNGPSMQCSPAGRFTGHSYNELDGVSLTTQESSDGSVSVLILKTSGRLIRKLV